MDKQTVRQAIRRQAYRMLAIAERLSRREHQLAYSPTFIVGPMRSGTTLVRQLVAWGLTTCHFTNLLAEAQIHLGYPLPVMTARIVRWLHGSPPLDRHYRADPFLNRYGHIPGKSAPAEGEMIWGYWFGSRYGPVEPHQLADESASAMYQAVAATENVFGVPFVNKTTVLSLRIPTLAKVFPNALFVQVHRDRVDTAQSIYRARRGDYPEWLGAKPRECEGVEEEPLQEQICKQVFYVERAIAHAREAIGEGRFLSVSYRNVCEDPRQQLERIASFLRGRGAPVRRHQDVPNEFRFSHGRKIPEAEYHGIRSCLQQLAEREGEEWARRTA